MEGYKRYRIENQVKQILNCAVNFNLDKENLFDVVRIYNKILENKSRVFSQSLIYTANLLKGQSFEDYDEYIRKGVFLENDNSDSFLIFPMFSNNHAFYGILRKVNCEYSYTIVNRGDRWFHQKYEEYIIYDIKKFMEFLKEVSVQTTKKTEEIYQTVLELSKNNEVNLIRVDQVAQKNDNCFIKELESAIKYAYSTRKGNESGISIRKLREKDCFLHRPRWNISNLEMHGKYVEELKKENANLSESLDYIYKAYIINKRIKKLSKTLPLKSVIDEVFINSIDPVRDFLKMVDIDNLKKLVMQIDDIMIDELSDKYKKLKIAFANLKTRNILKLYTNEDFLELHDDFTNLSEQLKEKYADMYFAEACKSKKTIDFDKQKRLVEQTLVLVPFISKAYILRVRLSDNNMVEKCIEDCNKAIFIEPCVAINYIEKARLLELARRYDEYEETLLKVFSLNKLTKDMCRNIADIFELKGDLNKSLKWVQIALSINGDDRILIEKEKTLIYRINSLFEERVKRKLAIQSKNEYCEPVPNARRVQKNSRERGII